MIVNVVSGTNEDGTPDNGLYIALTVQDVDDAISLMTNGAEVVELPSVNLDALMTGTDTLGHVSFIRFLVVLDEETAHAAIAEDLTNAGFEDFEIECHGDAPRGLNKDWQSPLQGVEADLAKLDQFDVGDLLGGDA